MKKVSNLFRNELFILSAAVLLFIVVAGSSINKASVWHDEGFTVALSSRSPIEIWKGSARDVHPPLYYVFLHFWMIVFGGSEIAIRSMSLIAAVGTILIGYILIKKYFGRFAASIGAFFLSLGPMLVRYSQEARMYGLLGLFLISGTYFLMQSVSSEKYRSRWLIAYSLVMAAGLYTHYFTVFALISHWIFIMTLQGPKKWQFGKSYWLRLDWWISNIAIVILWLPWLPHFYDQYKRGQGIGWIPPANLYTFPKNIWQNLTFTDGLNLPKLLFWAIPVTLIFSITWVAKKSWNENKCFRAISFYTFLPIIFTLLVSVSKPIYQDRYLLFTSIGMYILLSIVVTSITKNNRSVGLLIMAIILCTFCVGISNVKRQASHSMRIVGNYVNSRYSSGDEIISAELYTYFDFKYYCNYCEDTHNVTSKNHKEKDSKFIKPTTLKLNTSASSFGRPNGYGESSLLYDHADKIYVDDLNSIVPISKRIWLIGKPGQNDYWNLIPETWREEDSIKTKSSEARLYVINK